ncbi:auxin-responsive protein SAUR36-like [Aegilops tauschii subsp. strangulata]|uniref:Uncharacterized protein n=2 Tax=Aegilops tauschii TaxID=37682 RepID=A0A453LJ54_AEGTS
MVSAKRLAQPAKKWQRMAAVGRKRLAQSTVVKRAAEECYATTSVAVKGHAAWCNRADGGRFKVPLAYLGTAVFIKLLRMSQGEFGFTGSDDSRIVLPATLWLWNTPCACSGEMLPRRW